MKLSKVQLNQTTFGTKVNIDPFTARQISLSRAKNKILKDIKILEENGINDTLFLSYEHLEKVRASVLEQKDGKNYVNQYYISDFLRKQGFGKRNKYLDIITLYSKAKKNMVEIKNKSFEKFFPYVV